MTGAKATAGPTHVLRENFMSPENHRIVLDWALAGAGGHDPSTTGEGIETPTRRSLALRDFGPCRDIIRDAIKPIVLEMGRLFGVELGAKSGFDASLVAHNDGAFYKPHIDVGKLPEHRKRVLSFVYYFFRTPARFSGGELRLFPLDRPGSYLDVAPRDNALLVFPAMVPHEVRPVRCPSAEFVDSRFAINVWAHRPERRSEEMPNPKTASPATGPARGVTS